jgi:hypothetical protein
MDFYFRFRFQGEECPVPPRRALAWVLVAAVMWLATFAAAQVPAPYAVRVVYLSPEQIVADTDAAVMVRVERIETVRLGGRVYTDAHCSLLEVWYGDVDGETITVRQPGGVHDGLATFAGPLPPWQAGENWLLALNRPVDRWWTIHGIKQGAFKVDGELAMREFNGFTFIAPPPATVLNYFEAISLDELRRRMTIAPEDHRVDSADEATADEASPNPVEEISETPPADTPLGLGKRTEIRNNSSGEGPVVRGEHSVESNSRSWLWGIVAMASLALALALLLRRICRAHTLDLDKQGK